MARIILFLIIGNSSAQAKSIFTIENKKVTFLEIEKENLTLSKNCQSGVGLRCAAYTAFLRKSNVALTQEDLIGGKNPGSVKCRRLGGTVVIGKDSRQNENSFCKFEDNSFVECGSL